MARSNVPCCPFQNPLQLWSPQPDLHLIPLSTELFIFKHALAVASTQNRWHKWMPKPVPQASVRRRSSRPLRTPSNMNSVRVIGGGGEHGLCVLEALRQMERQDPGDDMQGQVSGYVCAEERAKELVDVRG